MNFTMACYVTCCLVLIWFVEEIRVCLKTHFSRSYFGLVSLTVPADFEPSLAELRARAQGYFITHCFQATPKFRMSFMLMVALRETDYNFSLSLRNGQFFPTLYLSRESYPSGSEFYIFRISPALILPSPLYELLSLHICSRNFKYWAGTNPEAALIVNRGFWAFFFISSLSPGSRFWLSSVKLGCAVFYWRAAKYFWPLVNRWFLGSEKW